MPVVFSDCINVSVNRFLLPVNTTMKKTAKRKELIIDEEKYRVFCENANDAIVIIQNDKIIFYNSRLLELSGYSPDELANIRISEHVFPEDRERILNYMDKRLSGDDKDIPTSYEIRLFKRNRIPVLLKINIAVITWNNEPAILVHAVDITEQKLMGESLKKSESRYRQFLDNVRIGYALVDLEGHLLEINKEFLRMTGYTEQELLGKYFYDITHESSIEKEKHILAEQVLKRGFSDPYEKIYIRKNGSHLYVELIVYLVIDDEGNTSGMWAFIRDLSESKLNEEKIRLSEEKYRSIAEYASEAILVIRDSMVIYHNKKFKEITGYSSDTISQMKLLEFIHPDDKDLMNHYMDSGIQGEDSSPSIFQVRGIDKTGRIKWFQINSTILKWEGKSASLIMMSDITELIDAEKTIVDSLREKEILLKEIHHRVKNNMQIISSLLNLQSDYIKDQEDLMLFKESQDRIRAMSLVHESLYHSKDLANIDFKKYITELISYLFTTYNISPDMISLQMNVDSIVLDISYAIPCALVINELISNALKYAFPKGRQGEISLAFTRQSQDMYLLDIEDNGIGIPPHIKFDDTTTLGLQLIKALVNQLKGSVNLIVKDGTRFKILIPAKHLI